jgi:hypothetical protein
MLSSKLDMAVTGSGREIQGQGSRSLTDLERSDPAQLDPTGTLEGFDPTLHRVGSGSGRVNLGSWRCLG